MLHLIEGPAGSGKTTKAYELLLEGAERNKDRNHILVIPEQSSISAQKDIIDMSPAHGILNIDILSFNRLAHRIFEAAGGEAQDLIDDSGKNLIIRHIADDIRSELKVLGGELKKSGYVAEVRSVISEFMQYGIGPEDIPEIARKTGSRSPFLSRKLEDVALIYKRFREYMGNDFMTREELLVKASAEAHNAPFLKRSTLIFDSFTGFTPVQYTFIEALLTQCEDIYVTATRTGEARGGLFGLGDSTHEILEKLAEHSGGLDVIGLTEDRRHASESDIRLLGGYIFEPKTGDPAKNDGSVSFYTADGVYTEVRETLHRIAHLVREEGYHYRECGILMGDTAVYGDIVRNEAARLNIPVYVDQTRHISLNPFTELIRAAILVIKENYSYDSVFHLLRTGLTDIDTEDIDMAENYILATGIKGRAAYEKPFETIFRGVSKRDRAAAESVRLRLRDILSPLSSLMRETPEVPVSDLIRAVREIYKSLDAEEKLAGYVEYFRNEGKDPERAIEYSQIYDILNEQFDNMDSLIGSQKVSVREFSELYEDALSEIRVGVIPPKSDVVMAGDLTRSRFNHIRTLFFIGMAEGAIPASGNKGGLISDSDRQILQSIGIEVAPTVAENVEREKFYFYMNLMKPSEKVCFSYSGNSLDGAANRESYFMKEARRCMNTDEVPGVDGSAFIISGDDLIGSFAENMERDPSKASLYLRALKEYKDGENGTERITEALIKDSEKEDALSEEAGEVLFGHSFIESPTELEKFAACPYSHFLEYGLRLSERRTFEFEMRDIGTLLHKVLEIFSGKLAQERLSFRSVSDEKAEILLESAVSEAADDSTSGRIASLVRSGARYAYAVQRLKRLAGRSIDTLRFQAGRGSFDNIYFERRFTSAGLKGTIDRSDEAITDSGIYLDVIDYKTGNKTFDQDRVYYGLDIQLPLYMNAALELRAASAGGRIARPAGLFYYHVDDPVFDGLRNSSEDEISAFVKKELMLRGIVNGAPEVITSFDNTLKATENSLVIPAGLDKDGVPSAGRKKVKLYTEEQLRGMLDHTVRLTGDLKEKIIGGDISRSPYRLGNNDGCKYCRYKEICDGGRYRVLEKQEFPAAWTADTASESEGQERDQSKDHSGDQSKDQGNE